MSSTVDGANVNLGAYSGVLTQMKVGREWVVTIHYITVNSLLSPPGGLLISSALEGGLIGGGAYKRGRLIREGGLNKCFENF